MFPDIVVRLAQAMQARGGRLFVVGGTVRDMILGVPPKDFDLEVHGIAPSRLEETVASFHPSWMDTVGRSYGVLKVRIDGEDLDIAPPRRDSKVGEGHKGILAVPDPTMTLEEACRRRDFTVGAMAMDPLTGELFDFFGGQEDLRQGILRATDPERFVDDPLRVMRAVQFAARFGFAVEQATAVLCRNVTATKEFVGQSPARVSEEWRKLLLKSPQPSVGLQVGLELGVWDALHPELAALWICPQDANWHPEGSVGEHTKLAVDKAAEIVRREGLAGDDALVIILAVLLHDSGKPATTVFIDGRWRSPNHEAAGVDAARKFFARNAFGREIEARVLPLIADHLFPAQHGLEVSDAAIRRLAQRLVQATIAELVMVSEADVLGRAVPNREFAEGTALLEQAKTLAVGSGKTEPLLMGRHLISELGMKPNRQFSEILRAVFEAQLEGRVATIEQALDMAREIMAAYA
ncbi:MAG: CCA tRNA nucleotidyltransferase [Candidatus Spechtbacteria bacterium]|nr:CCA tRNA nucleotidyltransferase [Candidatus Spechtbacteria bacterium]